MLQKGTNYIFKDELYPTALPHGVLTCLTVKAIPLYPRLFVALVVLGAIFEQIDTLTN